MTTIPIELSKGRVISPLFIFDGKYRKFMGEYFTLIGLMYLAIIPALFFMIVPGIIISIGWSLAIYILLDKGLFLVSIVYTVAALGCSAVIYRDLTAEPKPETMETVVEV